MQKLIRSDSDIREGVLALRRRCAVLRSNHECAGDPPLRRYSTDFSGLARIVDRECCGDLGTSRGVLVGG